MVIHTRAINQLSQTDYLIIENEHKLLEAYLNNLCDACACFKSLHQPDSQRCTHEQQASCQGRLPSFLFSIIDLATNHFEHEEDIMLSRPHVTEASEHFCLHRQAHERILQKLDALVEKCLLLNGDGDAAQIYQKLHKELLNMFDEHNRNFDDPFLESTKTL